MNVDGPISPLPNLADAGARAPIVPLVPGVELRTLAALGGGAFVSALVFIIPPLFFPQMAVAFHVGMPLLGQILSLMLGLSVGLGFVVGPLSDRSGYRKLIIIGLVSATLCMLVFGLAPSFLVLVAASTLGAVTDAGVVGPSFAMAGTAFTGATARRAIGWTSAAQAGSAIVAVPLLAAVGAVAGWRMAFVGAGLLALAATIVAFRWLPHGNQHAAEPLRVTTILAPYRPLLRDRAMRRLYGAIILGAVCWFGLLTYLGAFLIESLELGTGQVGLVYMAIGLGYLAGSLAVGGPLAGVTAQRLVVIGFLGNALLFALAFSAQVGTLPAILLLIGSSVMAGVQGVAMTTLLLAQTPSGAGTTTTLSGSLFNLGGAGGGAIGGLLLALSGYEALAIGLPAFGVAAAVCSWQSAKTR